MNREIEFRGKHSNSWIYGYLLKDDEKYYIAKNSRLGSWYYVKNETIGQYTGLKDKNGKKIFEGDILLIGEKRRKVVVVFEHGQFGYLTGNNVCVSFEYQNPEVIGNIYEDNLESEVK